MSYFYQPTSRNQNAHYAQRPASTFSPSLTSVLSTEILSAREIENQEWVLFSPQMIPSSDYSELSPPSDLHMIQGDLSDIDIEDTPRQSLELPAHNGAGSFDQHARHDLMERVNMWRLDQSQLVFSELQRLERKFFPSSNTDEGDSVDRAPPDSIWSQIGHKVMENLQSFIHMDDEVLDVIFGHSFVDGTDKKDNAPEEAPIHSRQANHGRHGGDEWQDSMLSRIFPEFSGRTSEWMLLERLANWTLKRRRRPAQAPPLDTLVYSNPCFTEASLEHRWDFDTSSLSTQVF